MVVISEDLAELIGIHYGDGNINNYNCSYKIRYSINIRDEEYAVYIVDLVEKLFDKRPVMRTYPNKNYIAIVLESKEVAYFLHKNFNLPFGKKKNLRMPSNMKQNMELAKRFIRGIFDTDGCFTYQKDRTYFYPLLKITNIDKEILEDIRDILFQLNIKSFICKKSAGFDLVIRRKESYNLFLQLIQPKNNRGGTYDFLVK